MALAKDLVSTGYSFGQAAGNNGQIATGITAAGSTQGTATAITASINVVGTAAASTGLILYNGNVGDTQVVYNGGANAITVYPPVGSLINGLATNAGAVLATNTTCKYIKITSTRWIALLSA